MKQLWLRDNCKWDNLLILDACRYDVFNQIYGEYLDGELYKCWSPAPTTALWLPVFWSKPYREHTMVSAHPRVNSLGIHGRFGRHAVTVFNKVKDVWMTGWDERLGTVPPENICSEVGDGRTVCHFLQPHLPYIGEPQIIFPSWDWSEEEFPHRVLANLSMKTRRWGISHTELLREAYIGNLRRVLECVSSLVYRLEGVTVITSDHGEFLGENDKYLHNKRFRGEPIAHTVPWLVIE